MPYIELITNRKIRRLFVGVLLVELISAGWLFGVF